MKNLTQNISLLVMLLCAIDFVQAEQNNPQDTNQWQTKETVDYTYQKSNNSFEPAWGLTDIKPEEITESTNPFNSIHTRTKITRKIENDQIITSTETWTSKKPYYLTWHNAALATGAVAGLGTAAYYALGGSSAPTQPEPENVPVQQQPVQRQGAIPAPVANNANQIMPVAPVVPTEPAVTLSQAPDNDSQNNRSQLQSDVDTLIDTESNPTPSSSSWGYTLGVVGTTMAVGAAGAAGAAKFFAGRSSANAGSSSGARASAGNGGFEKQLTPEQEANNDENFKAKLFNRGKSDALAYKERQEQQKQEQKYTFDVLKPHYLNDLTTSNTSTDTLPTNSSLNTESGAGAGAAGTAAGILTTAVGDGGANGDSARKKRREEQQKQKQKYTFDVLKPHYLNDLTTSNTSTGTLPTNPNRKTQTGARIGARIGAGADSSSSLRAISTRRPSSTALVVSSQQTAPNNNNIAASYKLLGISSDATQDEIHKAFRRAALQLHPDKNKTPEAAVDFLALQNARDLVLDQNNQSKGLTKPLLLENSESKDKPSFRQKKPTSHQPVFGPEKPNALTTGLGGQQQKASIPKSLSDNQEKKGNDAAKKIQNAFRNKKTNKTQEHPAPDFGVGPNGVADIKQRTAFKEDRDRSAGSRSDVNKFASNFNNYIRETQVFLNQPLPARTERELALLQRVHYNLKDKTERDAIKQAELDAIEQAERDASDKKDEEIW